jgi:hypothetical protein
MPTPKAILFKMMPGVRVNLKVSSAKLAQFTVDRVKKFKERGRHQAQEPSPPGPKRHGLHQESDENVIPPGEAQSPQGADLPDPGPHLGVHGDHGPQHRAQAEDAGEHQA